MLLKTGKGTFSKKSEKLINKESSAFPLRYIPRQAQCHHYSDNTGVGTV